MRKVCEEFMKKNPAEKFERPKLIARPAGMSSSEDEADWLYSDDDGDGRDSDLDNLINDHFDRLSFGSNYDEQLDEYLNGAD